MNHVDIIIKKLNLTPLLPEGGFFARTYSSALEVNQSKQNSRSIGSAIYYLITKDNFSALHRLKCDEIFHFYAGDSVDFLILSNGKEKIIKMGSEILNDEIPQLIVPANTWQGLRLSPGGEWALLGTTCFPSFEYDDFELAQKTQLQNEYGHLADTLSRYLR